MSAWKPVVCGLVLTFTATTARADSIHVTSPALNETVYAGFSVTGTATGTWPAAGYQVLVELTRGGVTDYQYASIDFLTGQWDAYFGGLSGGTGTYTLSATLYRNGQQVDSDVRNIIYGGTR